MYALVQPAVFAGRRGAGRRDDRDIGQRGTAWPVWCRPGATSPRRRRRPTSSAARSPRRSGPGAAGRAARAGRGSGPARARPGPCAVSRCDGARPPSAMTRADAGSRSRSCSSPGREAAALAESRAASRTSRMSSRAGDVPPAISGGAGPPPGRPAPCSLPPSLPRRPAHRRDHRGRPPPPAVPARLPGSGRAAAAAAPGDRGGVSATAFYDVRSVQCQAQQTGHKPLACPHRPPSGASADTR